MNLSSRASGSGDGVAPITAPWPAKDVSALRDPFASHVTNSLIKIAYVAIVGGVMLMALLEWFLWLAAFMYCLVKVYQKATGKGKWGIRILAVLNMIVFLAMR